MPGSAHALPHLDGVASAEHRRTLAYGVALWCDAQRRGVPTPAVVDALQAYNLDPSLSPADHASAVERCAEALRDPPLLHAPEAAWVEHFEASLASLTTSRKRSGAFYTPPALAERLVGLAWPHDAPPRELRICDPSCGAGSFLLAAHTRLTRALEPAPDAAMRAARALVGIDLDPSAAALARGLLWRRTGAPWEAMRQIDGVQRGDALLGATATLPSAHPLGVSWSTSDFHLVCGNPPFLNQLSRRTQRDRTARDHLRARFPGCLGPYTDAALVFALLGAELCAPDGRVALILPLSSLSTRDGQAARRALLQSSSLEHLWFSLDPLFQGTEVRVCAPILRRGAAPAPVARSLGATFRSLAALPAPTDTPSWAHLVADAAGIPPCAPRGRACIGDVAEVSADFRDQYYGLRGALRDEASSPHPKLITTGLVDPATCRWGQRPTKLLGRKLLHPRVDVDALDEALQRWAARRRVPKLLLATQTRVLECVVDEAGAWLPSVPLLSISPHGDVSLWHLAAALSSPALSAVAAAANVGGALSTGAIKLSASQVRQLPLPAPSPAWDAAARAIEAAHREPTQRVERLQRCAEHMQVAYEAEAPVLAWWLSRLTKRGR